MANINPYSIVHQFEEAIAEYCGSKYAVSVESATAALFLSLMYKNVKGKTITIPSHTYPSVPCSIIHAGGKVKFEDINWAGEYELGDTDIWDSALRFSRGMYHGGLQCISFHVKKLLPIGRGGAILTDDEEAYKWFKKARFDGREPVPLLEDNFTMLGWNLYMQPQDAARGMQLLQAIGNRKLPDLVVSEQGYPNLSKFPVYNKEKTMNITLRTPTMEDATFLLELKNDYDTRNNSIVTTDEIKLENHLKWLENRLKSPGMNLILVDGQPVGDLRFDYGEETELSIRIHPSQRGKGIATQAIALAGDNLIAHIIEGNVASMRAFIENGFKPIDYIKGEKVNYYKLCKR